MFTSASRLQTARTPVVPTTDPYYSYVVALLHLDSENGDLTFPDQRGNTFTAGSSTGVVIVNDPTGSGGKVAQFDGTTGGVIDGPTNYESYRLHGDFTLEAYITPTLFAAVCPFISMGQTSGNSGMILYVNASGNVVASSGSAQYISSTQVLVANTRYHVALTRQSGLMTLWVDGQSGGTVTSSNDFTDGLLSIGGTAPTTYRYTGKIDEVRITNGISRYNNPFAPPPVPFPNNS